jgi:hypothetical protein
MSVEGVAANLLLDMLKIGQKQGKSQIAHRTVFAVELRHPDPGQLGHATIAI